MRTLIFILVGLAIAGIAMGVVGAARRRIAAAIFTVGWAAAVLWNLRTGMSHGYSLQEELPIQLLIFVVPVAAAWWLALKSRRG
ncbi:hypothetical protein SAMN05428982_3151 [Pseudoxanthomonas sp. CF385]|uniref:hypothetical protein n=1 Tax=Pseudoxanthomonas sp. CF385 TaxID=1881042 RepID=UPI00088759A5|nr:hypothetical protein [Pseudoxanthomonas sp. CF385]SDR11184.1 hypothetical protein SAMN05428982_3151 [Pseudoxanthomonas sp. CF385]